MRIPTLLLALSAVALASGEITAQASHPNFSGKWVIDQPATIEAAKAGNLNGTIIFGESFVATQTDKSITLDISAGGLAVTAIYALDGSESKNTSPPNVTGGAPIVVTATARWDGNKLVITSTSQSPGGPSRGDLNGMITVKSTRTMWIDEKGRLVIERAGTPPTVVPPSTSVYVKRS
jgi:hypothetical protein